MRAVVGFIVRDGIKMDLARCLNDSLPPITTTLLWFVNHVRCIVGAPQCPNVVDSTFVESSFFLASLVMLRHCTVF
ncbi:unnamed protein product [Ixodes persulcatus]